MEGLGTSATEILTLTPTNYIRIKYLKKKKKGNGHSYSNYIWIFRVLKSWATTKSSYHDSLYPEIACDHLHVHVPIPDQEDVSVPGSTGSILQVRESCPP